MLIINQSSENLIETTATLHVPHQSVYLLR